MTLTNFLLALYSLAASGVIVWQQWRIRRIRAWLNGLRQSVPVTAALPPLALLAVGAFLFYQSCRKKPVPCVITKS